VLRTRPYRARDLAKQVDRERRLAELFETSWTALLEMFLNRGAVLASERAQQVQFVKFVYMLVDHVPKTARTRCRRKRIAARSSLFTLPKGSPSFSASSTSV